MVVIIVALRAGGQDDQAGRKGRQRLAVLLVLAGPGCAGRSGSVMIASRCSLAFCRDLRGLAELLHGQCLVTAYLAFLSRQGLVRPQGIIKPGPLLCGSLCLPQSLLAACLEMPKNLLPGLSPLLQPIPVPLGLQG